MSDIIQRLTKAAKKKKKAKPISDELKKKLSAAHDKRAAKAAPAKKKKKAKKKNGRPDIDLAKMAKGSKVFAAPKKVKKAQVEPWIAALIKADMR